MAVSLVPVGPAVPPEVAAVLASHEDAIRALQQPGAPSKLATVALKADLTTYPASDWPECAVICSEINSIVVSTLVATTYTWLRANGGAL